jgi:hypothetical protein
MRAEALPDPEALPDAEPKSGRSLSRRTKLVIGLALGSAVLVLAVAPLLLMTIPDPHPYRLDTLAGERSGTFVVAADGYYKLYPYSAPLFDFPSDAFAVDSNRPTVIFKFRQTEDPDLYALRAYASDAPLALNKTLKDDTTLELAPAAALQPGDYVLTGPRDSVDERIDSFYFRVPG